MVFASLRYFVGLRLSDYVNTIESKRSCERQWLRKLDGWMDGRMDGRID